VKGKYCITDYFTLCHNGFPILTNSSTSPPHLMFVLATHVCCRNCPPGPTGPAVPWLVYYVPVWTAIASNLSADGTPTILSEDTSEQAQPFMTGLSAAMLQGGSFRLHLANPNPPTLSAFRTLSCYWPHRPLWTPSEDP
jgi:hypothetical protein